MGKTNVQTVLTVFYIVLNISYEKYELHFAKLVMEGGLLYVAAKLILKSFTETLADSE